MLGSPKIRSKIRTGGTGRTGRRPVRQKERRGSKRGGQGAVVALTLVTLPAALAACSSGTSSKSGAGTSSTTSGGGATAVLAKAPASVCQQLNAVFSDGPDPDADPVGYALSQILPLRNLHLADTALMATVSKLVTDDEDLVKANGADNTLAAAAIKTDDKAINSACPGVAP